MNRTIRRMAGLFLLAAVVGVGTGSMGGRVKADSSYTNAQCTNTACNKIQSITTECKRGGGDGYCTGVANGATFYTCALKPNTNCKNLTSNGNTMCPGYCVSNSAITCRVTYEFCTPAPNE
jgi:hypothetical protein